MTPAPQDHTLAQQLSGAFVFFGALVAGAFLLTALAYGVGRVWLTPELERSQVAARAESAAHVAMLDQEVGLRGYLLSRDVAFLDPYARGRIDLERAHESLAAHVGTVPELAVAMLETRLAEERWSERWARAVAETRPGDASPSMSEGKALFDVYRRKQTAFADGLHRRVGELAQREQRLVEARVLLELAVFVLVLLLSVRQHRALREAIVTPVAALLRHIRRIRDGALEATAPRAGPRELAELAAGLNEMVSALALAQGAAASRDDALREHSLRLRQILDASREFSESLNLAYVVGAVRASTAAVGGYDRVIVWLMDEEKKRLVDTDVDAERSATDRPSDAPAIEMGQGLAGRAAKSGRMTFEGPQGEVRFSGRDGGLVRGIAIPLIVGARVVGALEARHAQARLATTEAIEVLEMLATHAATAIESARLHEVIEERSQVDALTRLFNRRRLEEDLGAECKRSVRYGCPLSFVMLDVDHFKAFNDAHGHPQADTVLQELAEIVASSARMTDTAYRYGGEEFCILLRETDAEGAVSFAERLRQRVEQRFTVGGTTGITVSLGVADFSADAPTMRALVEAADVAMYASKHAGRNRVTLTARPLVSATPEGALPRRPPALPDIDGAPESAAHEVARAGRRSASSLARAPATR